MIKIITENKWTILGIIILCCVILNISMRFFDKRPFRFEDFKTADDLKMYLEVHYPIGSDGDVAYKDIELAGAKCKKINKDEKMRKDLKKYDYIGWCEYSSGWLSWPPMRQYQILVLGDKNDKITKFSVGIYNGFDF